MRARLTKAHGFTLIELLVVILIIGILIAVSAPSFLGQTKKAHTSAAEQRMAVAYRAAKAFAVNDSGQSFSGFDHAQLVDSEPELAAVQVGVSGAGTTLSAADVEGGVCYAQTFDVGTGPGAVTATAGATAQSDGTCAAASSAPANDDFANAQVVTLDTTSGSFNGTLVDATVENSLSPPEEPYADASSFEHNYTFAGDPNATVWYKFTAPADGHYSISTSALSGPGASAYPVIDIVRVTRGSGAWAAQVPSAINWTEMVSDQGGSDDLRVAAGKTYYIRIANSAYDSPAEQTGTFMVNWSYSPPATDGGASELFPTELSTLTPQVGSAVTVDPGVWEGLAPITVVYTWWTCPTNSFGGGCTTVASGSNSYMPVSGDAGQYLFAEVDHNNADASAQQFAGGTASIAP